MIVAAYNEEANIGRLLKAVLGLIGGEDEVIVVASGCTDNTVPIVRAFERADGRVRAIVEGVRRGKASAINKALETARGDVLAFLPADVIPARGFLSAALRRLGGGVGVVSCRPVPTNPRRGFSNVASRLIWDIHDETMAWLERKGALMHASGEGFVALREAVKPIPRDIVNDDAYIAVAARLMGYRVAYSREAVVFTRGPGSLRDLMLQRIRVLYGHYQIRSRLGRFPTVFEFTAMKRPLAALKILVRVLSRDPRYILTFPLLAVMELLAHAVVWLSKLRGGDYSIWPQIASTKAVITG